MLESQVPVVNQEPPKSRVRETLSFAALVVTVTLVLLATMWPAPLDRGYEGSIAKVLDVLHRNGIPVWFGYNRLEFSANILMFLPVGFVVALALPARIWWLSIVLCPALSVAIELIQGSLLSARFSTPLDVLANTLGAVLGITIAVCIRAIVHDRDEKIIARALWRAGRG